MATGIWKALVPVAGKPFLAHQLELLHARGIRRAVLCIGYLGEMIQRDFGDEASVSNWELFLRRRKKLLGTGGRNQTRAAKARR